MAKPVSGFERLGRKRAAETDLSEGGDLPEFPMPDEVDKSFVEALLALRGTVDPNIDLDF